MTTLHCAISGIPIAIPHFSSLTIPYTTGLTHPIFKSSRKSLNKLYVNYIRNELTPIEAYLLFLALLNKTGQAIFRVPASCDPEAPTTISLIAKNLPKLIAVLERTKTITHPSFTQPSYVIYPETSNLSTIPNYIEAWNNNIDSFLFDLRDAKQLEALNKVSNELLLAIKSARSLPTYTDIVANWADQAAIFPKAKRTLYRSIIVSAFDELAMLKTPLTTLKELKVYCEENIEVGTLHYHELMKVLNTAITNHTDYLGISNFTLLDADPAVYLSAIPAPTNPPNPADYKTKLEYVKAKLAYTVGLSKRTPHTNHTNPPL